jgi:hypothetical protein
MPQSEVAQVKLTSMGKNEAASLASQVNSIVPSGSLTDISGTRQTRQLSETDHVPLLADTLRDRPVLQPCN